MVARPLLDRLAPLLDAVQILIVAIVFAAPVLWMVMAGFKDPDAVTALPPQLIFHPTLQNYTTVLTTMPFLRFALNSVVVAGGSTAVGVALGVPAAFAVSWNRMRWPTLLMLSARMAPGALFLLPWFVMFSAVGAVGSFWVLIVTHAAITLPLALWTMLPFFDALPRELTEAARIDGCSDTSVLLRVVLPLVGPGLAVSVILCFVFAWNYFLFALVLSDINSRTLIVAAFNFVGEGVTDWGALMAAATLIALPPVVVTFLGQRWLIAGLTAGAVKG
ncbi:MAG TPA: carbohydrate ABC transporter permease [Acetobacteraceae bacterium]|jgi:multiple sugar transport system permease protein